MSTERNRSSHNPDDIPYSTLWYHIFIKEILDIPTRIIFSFAEKRKPEYSDRNMRQTLTRFTIIGVIQGVGFRPFIRNACIRAGISGSIRNTGDGVEAVVDDAETFKRILAALPIHMRIDSIRRESIDGRAETGFRILESTGNGHAEIPPDFFLCDDCLAELTDPENRRCGYFFLTCTLCGPRFTIAESSPYDRATTTMRDFAMCPDCRKEYTDPSDRRFHAQTIACPVCGPKLTLYEHGKLLDFPSDTDKLRSIGRAFQRNEIVAIKGVGGFHLFCNTEKRTIRKLDTLTGRHRKPYAVLCRDIAMARGIATFTPEEERRLLSPERPIVLARRNARSPDASELDTIGIMLASTALHILLFEHFPQPLICTSSNLAHAPLTVDRTEQFVPLVLDHDRRIVQAADDSVLKIIDETPLLIRRSRGFVPRSIALDSTGTAPILALGAEMNNTFALYDGHGRVTLSQHIGNTTHPETLDRYRATIDRFLTSTRIAPQVLLCDAHPEYQTSLYGRELAETLNIPLIPIQHHRAHAFAVAAEHGLDDFMAIICDGLGYGDDGTLWGGEIFENHRRIGHLELHPQLGGDAAGRFPHRMLYSILRSFLSPKEIQPFLSGRFSSLELTLLEKQFDEKFQAPLTSSCGRVLDAASALLDFCDERTYDGRPAMLLEAHSTKPFDLAPVIEGSILKTTPLFRYLIENLHEDKGRLAATVQYYLAAGLYSIAAQQKKPIVWAGGCAYNRIMTGYFLSKGVLINKDVPPGDGGISFGQIAAYLKSETV